MSQVEYVRAARASKKVRRCAECGHEIQVGEPYKYYQPRTGAMTVWCQLHTPKRSQTTSTKLGPVYDAVDDFDVSNTETVEEIKGKVEEVISVAQEIRDEYEEALSNMASQEGMIAEGIQEKIDTLDGWITELENFEPEGATDDDVRPDIEIMVVREMLDEKGIDYEDYQLTNPIDRGHLIEEHLDYTEFENQVNERCEAETSGGIEEARSTATDLVQQLEL